MARRRIPGQTLPILAVGHSLARACVDRIDQPTGVRPDGALAAPTFATTPTNVLLPLREEQVPPTREQVDKPITSDRIPVLEWHAIDVEREGTANCPAGWACTTGCFSYCPARTWSRSRISNPGVSAIFLAKSSYTYAPWHGTMVRSKVLRSIPGTGTSQKSP